jgi:hypothetical protein
MAISIFSRSFIVSPGAIARPFDHIIALAVSKNAFLAIETVSCQMFVDDFENFSRIGARLHHLRGQPLAASEAS